MTAPDGKANDQEEKSEHGLGCRDCSNDENPLPLVQPQNDLTKDTKKSSEQSPFSLNSNAGDTVIATSPAALSGMCWSQFKRFH